MVWSTISNAMLIFSLRLTDVSMGTVRMILTMRGTRKLAALIGFIEVSIWVVAISRVIGNIDSLWSVLGYGGGFAAGTLLGMWIEDRLALGYVFVHVISMTQGRQIARDVRQAGYGATLLRGEGQSGPVHMVDVVAPRKRIKEILNLVNEADSKSFVTVEEARQVLRGYQPMLK